MANARMAPGYDGDLEALRVTQPLLQAEVEEYDSSAYSWVLLEDHPLRSPPTEVECHPEILSFSRKCVGGLRRSWREHVLPLLCLVLMFLVVVQFLLQIPRVASYFLEPAAVVELPGFIQLSSMYGQSTSLTSAGALDCSYSPSPAPTNEVSNDVVEVALDSGCTSARVNLWLRNHDLLVGSNCKSLEKERTLQSVYLQPLEQKLDALNSPSNTSDTAGSNKSKSNNTSPIGLFGKDPTQSFTLFLNIHTPARTTWPRLVTQLRALDDHGYLSYRSNATQDLSMRPVTIVLAEREGQRLRWIDRLSQFMRGKS
ncbi:hypothetical protein BJY01DRAFT_209808 [Aspergillus pseudoustus]|uniref:Uncharacterized protein n=1 Tax=Aspergillus pseudoustus TaxID=1810923 RepID=A0ABR4KFH9_9EURO